MSWSSSLEQKSNSWLLESNGTFLLALDELNLSRIIVQPLSCSFTCSASGCESVTQPFCYSVCSVRDSKMTISQAAPLEVASCPHSPCECFAAPSLCLSASHFSYWCVLCKCVSKSLCSGRRLTEQATNIGASSFRRQIKLWGIIVSHRVLFHCVRACMP